MIDEAHRLRNVYKPSNKIGNAIKGALAPFDKLLLTATPLQNSLQELFGLVSIIDEHIFGDIKSFRSQFSRLDTDGDFQSLRERLKPIWPAGHCGDRCSNMCPTPIVSRWLRNSSQVMQNKSSITWFRTTYNARTSYPCSSRKLQRQLMTSEVFSDGSWLHRHLRLPER